MNSSVVREKFFQYFKDKGHEIIPSASVINKTDKNLMFTNAGMNQFRNIFTGDQDTKFSRVANSQKCLRVSGKHNDLEEVGVDTYHHTFFEMLGNWSFGDYFKKEIIEWSFDLITNVYGLEREDLYVSVFEGSEDDNTEFDKETFDEWKKYFSQDKIINGNKKDNFWEMGDTGPCGPCSEIHIDLRSTAEKKKIKGADLVNKDSKFDEHMPEIFLVKAEKLIVYDNTDQSIQIIFNVDPSKTSYEEALDAIEKIGSLLNSEDTIFDDTFKTPSGEMAFNSNFEKDDYIAIPLSKFARL